MKNPNTMRAIQISSFDGPDKARVVDFPLPEAGPGEALIRVKAAGINFADTMQASGTYVNGPQPPYIAGLEACGEIVAINDDRSPFNVDDQVIVVGKPGAFAEYYTVPTAGIFRLPDGWSDAQGAAFFVDWVTAYACLKINGQIESGQTVLIHAAAGGLGQAAVILAKHWGATVFATASTREKLEIARRLGADELINYGTQDFAAVAREKTGGRGVDLVLEMVGGEAFRKGLSAIVPYGRMVVYGAASGQTASLTNFEIIFDYTVSIIGQELGKLIVQRPDLIGPAIEDLNTLIASGVIVPEEPRTFDLADAGRAMSELASRNTTGKLVLIP